MSSTTTTAVKIDTTEPYLWMVIIAGFTCFFFAWGIGANDVANSFGTSIGAKAISLQRAMLIAAFFEFTGALFLGSTVANTVRKKIISPSIFEGDEDLLLLGMFCALLSSGLWMYFATKYSLAVSTTQSIVGSIIGFAVVAKGFDAVSWSKVYSIMAFWVLTPLLSMIAFVIFYLPTRTFLLRKKNAYELTLKYWPLFVFFVACIMSFFLIIKGLKRIDAVKDFGKENFFLSFVISFAIGCVFAVISYFIFIYKRNGQDKNLVEKFVEARVEEKEKAEKEQKSKEMEPKDSGIDLERVVSVSQKGTSDGDASATELTEKSPSRFNLLSKKLTKGVNVDIHEDLKPFEKNLHNKSENFTYEVEKSFAWLQVCSACLGIFAHGSNDVANAVAPFAAIVSLYELNGEISKKAGVPDWILALGGVGMAVGILTYGYKIMKVLGVRMAAMSSTRGYCIEMSSALVVIIASHYGYPASTTHAQVGCTVGSGIMELSYKNTELTWKEVVNWKLLIQTLIGWVFTLILSAILSAGLYSFLAYSPYAGTICRQ